MPESVNPVQMAVAYDGQLTTRRYVGLSESLTAIGGVNVLLIFYAKVQQLLPFFSYDLFTVMVKFPDSNSCLG